jgi:receptor protein-tyrosine kinase
MSSDIAVPISPIFSASRSIGDILVATGRLSSKDAARILEYQKANNVQFGDAAITLKLLTKDDIDFALGQQYDYSYLSAANSNLSPALLTAYQPFSTVSENMRAVRSQLMLRWFNKMPERKVMAVVSPGKQDGRTFVASNLAVVFAQQGQRTLVIDADLRSDPDKGQQALFKTGRSFGLSGILANRAGLESAQLVPGLPNLAILSAGAKPPNPQELLGRLAFSNLLEAACTQFDVIIVDTPASTEYADAEIIASRAGVALVVGRKNKTLVPAITHLSHRLQGGGISVIGSVLNDA